MKGIGLLICWRVTFAKLLLRGSDKSHGETMRIVSLIDKKDVIERILRRLGLWQDGVRVHCPLSSLCAHGSSLSASNCRPRPRRAKSDFLSVVGT